MPNREQEDLGGLPLLGVYVHTAWVYRRPYGARTWTLSDWRHFLAGLSGLGYNLIQIWPLIDSMPRRLTESDRNYLALIAEVIEIAHDEFDMRVFVGACANTMGTEDAGRLSFLDRPYYANEHRLNPADPEQMNVLFDQRREAVSLLRKADGFWVIDSDPGGYPGSPPSEFVDLLVRYRQLLDELREGIELIYWVWFGWPGAQQDESSGFRTDSWQPVLEEMIRINPEPWLLHITRPAHVEVFAQLDLLDRACVFPYGRIEHEPSMPFTRNQPKVLFDAIRELPGRKGLLGNAQTHCLQLPGYYYMSHFAKGGTPDDADLKSFAEQVVSSHGDVVAGAWQCMNETTLEQIDEAIARTDEVDTLHPGMIGGLLFGDAGRFLSELRLQLRLRRAAQHLKMEAEGGDVLAALRAIHEPLAAWTQHTGYRDFSYSEPIIDTLRSVAKQCGLDEFEALWSHDMNPTHQAGYMTRYLDYLGRL